MASTTEELLHQLIGRMEQALSTVLRIEARVVRIQAILASEKLPLTSSYRPVKEETAMPAFTPPPLPKSDLDHNAIARLHGRYLGSLTPEERDLFSAASAQGLARLTSNRDGTQRVVSLVPLVPQAGGEGQ